MRYNKVLAAVAVIFLAASCSVNGNISVSLNEPVDFVNPYIGNISHLLVPTYPTVHLPNGMMRIYPVRDDYTSDKMYGLPLIVTSHRGGSRFNLSFTQDTVGFKPVYSYHYDNEEIRPYHWSVYFEEEEVSLEYAPSEKSGIYVFTFEKKGAPTLVFNTAEGKITTDGKSVNGFQRLANEARIYFHAEFSENPVSTESFENGEGNYLTVTFPEGTEKLALKYGTSFIDTDQADKNLSEDIPDFNIDKVTKDGRDAWNDALGKIEISGGKRNDKVVFYTSLYRTYERMTCITEDGRYYNGFDNKVHEDKEPFYTDDWVWDTYRAAHPLRIILDPEKEVDMINSFARMSQASPDGWMPTFPCIYGDSHSMNSNHGVAFVADAWAKGLRGFNLDSLYKYCKAAITEKTLAPWEHYEGGKLSEFYFEHGYIPALHDGEVETLPEVHDFESRQPVAVTLGTSFDEWCLSQIAGDLGNTEDSVRFANESMNYHNVWNPETKFFHPKDSAGNFIEPFSYERSGGMGARNAYDENNGWVYRWDVQHNIGDLVEMMGGNEAFVSALDSMFCQDLGDSKYSFYSQLPDHTGNVGQFSMANEPSFHIPYLYCYAGAPWKTQKRIRTLLTDWYRNDLMGVPGDEDGGGMTAFVVFSMMGFYPVTPGIPVYVIGSPVFRETTIDLDNGKEFTVKADNYDAENKYIQSAELNGQPLDRCWFTHSELMEGGRLVLTMGPKPNKEWGAATPPPSFSME